MNNQEIDKLKTHLMCEKKISIIPHRNPDGDAIGSCLALYGILKKMGHTVRVISPNDLPLFLQWMPNADGIGIYEKNIEKERNFIETSNIVFALDFNALHRTGECMEELLQKVNVPFVMIDHHQMPDDFAEIVFSNTDYGSTCELLFNIIEQLGFNHLIDKDIATCFYTGIVTDSGSFRFPKTTSHTHKVVAQLIEKGIDNPTIHNALFNNNSYNKLQLLGKALENMKIIPEHKVAYTYLLQEELNKFNHQKGDTEGIVNYGLSIKGIIFAAIFIENKEEGIIKISFRSEGTDENSVDVNEFSRKYFCGGGHKNAAGGKSLLPMKETIEKFENIIYNL